MRKIIFVCFAVFCCISCNKEGYYQNNQDNVYKEYGSVLVLIENTVPGTATVYIDGKETGSLSAKVGTGYKPPDCLDPNGIRCIATPGDHEIIVKNTAAYNQSITFNFKKNECQYISFK